MTVTLKISDNLTIVNIDETKLEFIPKHSENNNYDYIFTYFLIHLIL